MEALRPGSLRSLRFCHVQDRLPLVIANRRDGKARLADQLHLGKTRLRLDFGEGNGPRQGLDRLHPDRHPVRVFGIGLRLPRDPHDPDDLPLIAAMVEERLVSLLHRPKVDSRGRVSNSVPFGRSVPHEVVPAVDAGFGFHQPMRHAGTSPSNNAVTPTMSRAKAAIERSGISGKLNNLKEFRILPQLPTGSPNVGWTLVNVNISGFQRMRASEPKAL